MSGPGPQFSILVVSYNVAGFLERNIGSFVASTRDACEFIFVDNASQDGSADMIAQKFPWARLIRNQANQGFAAAVNQAAGVAAGRYLVLLNPDATPAPDALRAALKKMERRPKAGIGGGLLTSTSGVPQPSARQFPSPLNWLLTFSGLAAKYPRSRFFGKADRTWAPVDEDARVDWVPGAFAVVRKDVFDRLGGFDERFFLYYEEVDLCRRMERAGYEAWYWPEIKAVHEGGGSARLVPGHFSKHDAQVTLWERRSRFLYYRKHHGPRAAWLIKALEIGCHRLRIARRTGDSKKREQSLEMIRLIETAWRETAGGAHSPPRPWN